ncbi:LETM1 domain containing protein [Asbolus verrucosus]|uniref:LETM1 domain containing protein n=1 Tax=Asbolus verrucosus TaxID=1661398 RepID=A0A482VBH6_ASBVE|nr:LETM1 domain containing protein [Asbolus verrucosus]
MILPNLALLKCGNTHGYIETSVRYFQTTRNPLRKSVKYWVCQVEQVKKIRYHITRYYLKYMKNHVNALQKIEKNFPVAIRMYRVFSEGIKIFARDIKEYVKIARLIHAPGQRDKFQSLTRREIELYHQMPKDMRHVTPILLLSALPIVCYVIFPIAYMFPRQLLSSHFWNLQQKSEFNLIILKSRIKHCQPLLSTLQNEIDKTKNSKLHHEWIHILGMIGSGFRPKIEQILSCKELFRCPPLDLHYLSGRHVKHLLKLHDLHTGLFRRTRLAERALILKEMDRAIVREGGVQNLSKDALKNACFIRGLNPINMRKEDMIKWLNNWITISSVVDKGELSLLLHCSMLLAYNEPSNWQLIYYKRKKW